MLNKGSFLLIEKAYKPHLHRKQEFLLTSNLACPTPIPNPLWVAVSVIGEQSTQKLWVSNWTRFNLEFSLEVDTATPLKLTDARPSIL